VVISSRFVVVIFFLPVTAAVVIITAAAVEDSSMVHHTDHSGTTVQKQVASRQQRLFDVATKADMVQVLVSDRRSVHCGVLACGQTRRVGPGGCRTHWRIRTDETRGVLLCFQTKTGDT
jgi:hypothetical protein